MYKILANVGFASKNVFYLPSCHSTNEEASKLVGDEGMIIITDEQLSGKGQRGNTWESAPFKNLTFSLVLRPSFLPVQQQFKLTQAISLGIAHVIQTMVSKVVKIKWPNDIYVGEKKIGGILIQNSVKGSKMEYSIVGIGLNVNQNKFLIPIATSLSSLTGKTFELNNILNEVVSSIYEYYDLLKQGSHKAIDKEYQQVLYQLNETKKYDSKGFFDGKIIGVDPLGRLMIETEEGVRCFQHQEVKFLKN